MNTCRFYIAFLFFLGAFVLHAQTDEFVRYVKTSDNGGAYGNDGKSWNTARNNLQAVINELKASMNEAGVNEGGRIYVAAGTYTPTELVGIEENETSFFASFKIPEGISLYGGYPANANNSTDTTTVNREMEWGSTGMDDDSYRFRLKHKTVLSGDMLGEAAFTYHADTRTYSTRFPGNAYHVVWFATNGFDADGNANKLNYTAVVDGFTIKHGNASNREGKHYGRGGGVYLVEGGVLSNCTVTENSAAEMGGGVFAEGGEVNGCYIYRNICMGSNISTGYGGGLAMRRHGYLDGCFITHNQARNGGGMVFFNPDDFVPEKEEDYYQMIAATTLVANNTATSEAGGVYFYNGGFVNQFTVVRNYCQPSMSSSVGRSGGVYVKNRAVIINSVLWGCEQGTSDVPYHKVSDSQHYATSHIYYSAIDNLDLCNWTGTTRVECMALESENAPATATSAATHYPVFSNPDVEAGILSFEDQDKYIEVRTENARWRPYSFSSLREKGFLITDVEEFESVEKGLVKEDITGHPFNVRTTIGAYQAQSVAIQPYTDPSGVKHLYVDPDFSVVSEDDLEGEGLKSGDSWDNPLNFLNDALAYFRETLKVQEQGYVHVKEGTVSLLGNYGDENKMRSALIDMVSNVEVRGGYPSSLTGTDVNGRNPMQYPSVIDAAIGVTYAYNAYHGVVFRGVNNAVLDGFRIVNANASTIHNSNKPSYPDAGGIWVVDNFSGYEGSMSGNVVRNCVIENCRGDKGGAVCVSSSLPGFSLTIENCVINNNEGTMENAPKAAVYADIADGSMGMNHCTVVRNVGYPVYAAGNTKIELKNSWIWCNTSQPYSDAESITVLNDIMPVEGVNLTASYCAFDKDKAIAGNGNLGVLTYVYGEGAYPSSLNPSRNTGITENAYNTVYGGYTDFTPNNMNPVVNKAFSSGGDEGTDLAGSTRNYGGLPDIGAIENTRLPAAGTVFYVTATGAGKKDGSSWENAIAGNVIYDLERSERVMESGQEIFTTDARYIGFADENKIYGEKSGASYPFLDSRTGNQIERVTERVQIGFLRWGDRLIDLKTNITNNREEQYISGLQYAVEKASMSSSRNDKKQVWVAGGIYTDYKGFVIRDNVEVLGGFPNVGTPGISERHPLLSEFVPENGETAGMDSKIYETILQIQEQSPVRWSNNNESTPNAAAFPEGAIRKPVLFQPDVCLTTAAPSRFFEQVYVPNDWGYYVNQAYPNHSDVSRWKEGEEKYGTYKEYDGATWDGFTIRHGFYHGYHANRDGGAGVRMFRGVTLKNCVIKDNYNGSYRNRGGGIYCDGSNSSVINCFIINNAVMYEQVGESHGSNEDSYGGGMYMIVGTGYNLLVANNFSSGNGGGIFIEDATFYNNTIAYNTTRDENYVGGLYQFTGSTDQSTLNMYNCLFYGNTGKVLGTSNANYFNGIYKSYVHSEVPIDDAVYNKIEYSFKGSDANSNPFEKGANAQLENNYRLSKDSKCVNNGENEPKGITLPDMDVDFTDRIKDCTVDIGAYEYNGAYDIMPTPDNTAGSETNGAYVYYVTQAGAGNASANSPENAACMMKLQSVLDAAGRAKAKNPDGRYIVKLARVEGGGYVPLRSIVTEMQEGGVENPRSYSLIVPKGVEVWGGYTDDFEGRNITANATYLTGEYYSGETLTHAYHTVVFTDRTFDENGEVLESGIIKTDDRAVLDGLFITGGLADGDGENANGAGAVVTAYAHIRNCIVTGNEASGNGGGLYLLPGAYVSGTLVKNNIADDGGGIYAEDEGDSNFKTYVFTSTVVRNTARSEGGGLFFKNLLRTNSSVFWGNSASSSKDVFGNTLNVDDTDNLYPFAYTAVENLRLPGTNNRSLSPNNAEGPRFVQTGSDIDEFYMIQQTSLLGASGMPYETYTGNRDIYGWTDNDFAGTERMHKDEDHGETNRRIDIGARALVDYVYPPSLRYMKRIFVASDEVTPSQYVDDILDDEELGRRGASFVYPMYDLNDALDYIRDVRNSGKKFPEEGGEASEYGKVEAAETEFEIFISQGTFVPTHSALGVAKEGGRTNTYTIPEGVSLYGGFIGNETYCQHTEGGAHTVENGVVFDGLPTSEILTKRELADMNNNGLVGMWEMAYPTILSGEVNNMPDGLGAYHVIYACADEGKVGKLPEPPKQGNDGETDYPIGKTIKLDGITIMGGYAAMAEDILTDLERKNYYKGGAVCVDGRDYSDEYGNDKYNSENHNFRHIPLILYKCNIYGNTGGLGGAIYNNGDILITSSTINANEAVQISGVTEETGLGGGVYTDEEFYLVNSLLSNNEAQVKGGALYSGGTGKLRVVNSTVVRNKANSYPAVYSVTANRNKSEMTLADMPNMVANTLFWGNEAVTGDNYVINYQDASGHDVVPMQGAMENLWFCAYESGRGSEARTEISAKDMDYKGNYDFASMEYNNNVIVSSENGALDGPAFRSPSAIAGLAGFMEDADWSLTRKSSPLVDAGWGRMVQKGSEDDIESAFVPNEETEMYEGVSVHKNRGLYVYWSQYGEFPEILLPCRENDDYVKRVNGVVLQRISLNPDTLVTYIDIGLYEYRHTKLASGTDVLYVSTTEQAGVEADGTSWEQATSNLQGAIESLLGNRNGHAKMIKISEGLHVPQVTAGFIIDTKNGSTPSSTTGDDYNVKFLKIIGGYAVNDFGMGMEENRNPYVYKTVLSTLNSQTDCLFKVQDIMNREKDESEESAEREVIPLVIDGLAFTNRYGSAFSYDTKYGMEIDPDEKNIDYTIEENGESRNETEYIGGKKLRLVNCMFYANGGATVGDAKPVISITERGGGALLVNNVIHSNNGIPLKAEATKVVNSTFGRNAGAVTLNNGMTVNNKQSGLYNSVIWNGDVSGTINKLFEAGEGLEVQHNAIQTYTPEGDDDTNTVLGTVNDDVQEGPNFIDPQNTNVALRDYSLNPSLRLLEKGSNQLYRDEVLGDGSADLTLEKDASYAPRLVADSIDLGAYEFNKTLHEILYVEPGKAEGGTGNDWENSQNDLQEAIDQVTVYAGINADKNPLPTVFVKRGTVKEDVTVHAGVRLYGSISEQEMRTVDETVTREMLRDARHGLASPGNSRTVLHNLVLENNADGQFSLADGLEVTGSENTGSAVVVGKNALLVNSMVHDNVTDDPTVKNEGVLYNVLLYRNQIFNDATKNTLDNTDGTVIHLTVQRRTEGYNPAMAGIAYRTLRTYRWADSNGIDPYAPYMRDQTDEQPLRYQLGEKSPYIDKGGNLDTTDIISPILKNYGIDYGNDRDLLGNPRMSENGVFDYGCFETWNVPDGETWTTSEDKRPVNGSVVYLHEKATLALGGQTSAFKPEYLLLKDGASLYGQGTEVALKYVGMERSLPRGWNLLAVPYTLSVDGIQMVSYDVNGVLSLTDSKDKLYFYDGEARARSLDKYYAENSPFWVETTTALKACEGFGLETSQGACYRFTAKDEVSSVYTEKAGEGEKVVVLTQHDRRNENTGGSPDFTYKENMGWNLFGIPYLVSGYDLNKINIPHIVYKYDNAKGAYDTPLESWKYSTAVSLGDAMFTQTAVLGDEEQLRFPLPDLSAGLAEREIPEAVVLTVEGKGGADEFIVYPDENSERSMDFRLGTDGLKLMAENDSVPQIYASADAGTRFSLLSDWPDSREIPLDVKAPVSETYTISLLASAKADEYVAIWLTDNETETTINLKEEVYAFTVSEKNNNDNRFILHFEKQENPGQVVYSVFVVDGTIYISGLLGNEEIGIYDLQGRLSVSDQATDNMYKKRMDPGFYIVTVVGQDVTESYKILVR